LIADRRFNGLVAQRLDQPANFSSAKSEGRAADDDGSKDDEMLVLKMGW
jgi:hypothetical protein